jgi:hypothetical protein
MWRNGNMIITEMYPDPAIIDIELPELELFDFETLFNVVPIRKNYGNLVVNDGRVTIPSSAPSFNKLCNLLESPIKEMTRKLMSMDTIRYPLFRNKNFDDWWDKEVTLRGRVAISPTIDKVGWSMPWHLDNRFIILSGIINVQENTTQTYFAKQNYHWNGFEDCEIIHKGQSSKFKGTAWINTEHTWHSVPQIETERKTILFNVFL